jgi:hypothetical protein
MSDVRKNSRWFALLLPIAGIGWWTLGYPPGWDWFYFPIIPTMAVSWGPLITLGTVVVGLYAGPIWLRDNV